MGFNVTMDKNQYNLKRYHRLVREMPVEFTFSDAEKLFGDETQEVLLKARKLRMIGPDKVKNIEDTTYYIKDLYCRHYKKGEYALNQNGVRK